jgi:NTE family protein
VSKTENIRERRVRAGAERYPDRVPVAACFGAGGAYGIAFNLGVAAGLGQAGIDLKRGPMMGTSSGSYTAAALRSNVSFEAVMEAWPKEVSWLGARAVDVTGPVFGDARDGEVAAVAVRLAPLRRTVLWGGEELLADIVAASSSPPPFAWPHKVAGRRYIDAGYASLSSADLAPLADLLVVVTPIWTGAGRAGERAARTLDREIRAYLSLGTCRVLHVAPDEPILELKGHELRNMFDPELARQVFPLARELGFRLGTEFVSKHR